jgi:hypothetical protein
MVWQCLFGAPLLAVFACEDKMIPASWSSFELTFPDLVLNCFFIL